MKRTLLAALLSLAGITSAHANGGYANGALTVHQGAATGYSETITTGGSSATGGVNGTGYAVNSTHNSGDAYAFAGGTVNNQKVTTFSGGNSQGNNTSSGYTRDGGYGQTAGGVGSDYSGKAWGSFDTKQWGANADVRYGAH